MSDKIHGFSSDQQNAPFFVDQEQIVLNQNGTWLSDGIEIEHEQTRKLFGRSLIREADGWYLRVGRERKKIEVEDTAYFVQRIDGSSATGYILSISDGTQERLAPLTLHYRPGRLTCRLANGEEAKFLHVPYFDLMKDLQEDEDYFYIDFNGHRVDLAYKGPEGPRS